MRFNHLFELLRLFPDEEWNYYRLSSNPNITLDYIKAHIDKEWNYHRLSSNDTITWEFVKANPNEPWHYYSLSKNPNITQDIIRSNPDNSWDKPQFMLIPGGCSFYDDEVRYDPDITWDIVKDNPDKFDFNTLSRNGFTTIISWQYDNSTYRKYPEWIRKEIRLTLYILRNIGVTIPNDVKYEILTRVADYLP